MLYSSFHFPSIAVCFDSKRVLIFRNLKFRRLVFYFTWLNTSSGIEMPFFCVNLKKKHNTVDKHLIIDVPVRVSDFSLFRRLLLNWGFV